MIIKKHQANLFTNKKKVTHQTNRDLRARIFPPVLFTYVAFWLVHWALHFLWLVGTFPLGFDSMHTQLKSPLSNRRYQIEIDITKLIS